jgi:hypothetical protein
VEQFLDEKGVVSGREREPFLDESYIRYAAAYEMPSSTDMLEQDQQVKKWGKDRKCNNETRKLQGDPR